MGIIADFVGGAADAAAKAAHMELQKRAKLEVDEANFLRERNLAELNHGWDQKAAADEREFRTSEREAEQTWRSSESEKQRSSEKELANIRLKQATTVNSMDALDKWYREAVSEFDPLLSDEQIAAQRSEIQRLYNEQAATIRARAKGESPKKIPLSGFKKGDTTTDEETGKVYEWIGDDGGDPNDQKNWRPVEEVRSKPEPEKPKDGNSLINQAIEKRRAEEAKKAAEKSNSDKDTQDQRRIIELTKYPYGGGYPETREEAERQINELLRLLETRAGKRFRSTIESRIESVLNRIAASGR